MPASISRPEQAKRGSGIAKRWRELSHPAIAPLFAETGDAHHVARQHVEHGVGVVFRAGAFDQRLHRAVVDAVDLRVVARMKMSLQDADQLARFLQDFRDRAAVADAVGREEVEALVDADDRLVRRLLQVRAEPCQFGGRYVGVAPLEIPPPIRHPVVREAGVENHEVAARRVERIVGLFLSHDAQKLRLGEVFHAMVSHNEVVLAGHGGELLDHPLEIALFHVERRRRIDQVAQADHDLGLLLLEPLGRLNDLGHRLSMDPRAAGRFVGIVQIGHQPDSQLRLGIGCGQQRIGEVAAAPARKSVPPLRNARRESHRESCFASSNMTCSLSAFYFQTIRVMIGGKRSSCQTAKYRGTKARSLARLSFRRAAVNFGIRFAGHQTSCGGQSEIVRDSQTSVWPVDGFGWVAEWSIAAVLKTAVGESPPGVRIPPHPLRTLTDSTGKDR